MKPHSQVVGLGQYIAEADRFALVIEPYSHSSPGQMKKGAWLEMENSFLRTLQKAGEEEMTMFLKQTKTTRGRKRRIKQRKLDMKAVICQYNI